MGVTLESIAADISRIERHLEKQNGRLSRVEERSLQNTANIEIQRSRCQLISAYSDKDLKRLEGIAESNRSEVQKVLLYAKENAFQIANLVFMLGILAKLLGWW